MEETTHSAVDCSGVHEVLPPMGQSLERQLVVVLMSLGVPSIGCMVSEQFRILSSTYFFSS